jgi:hypothetical protein
MPTNAISFAGFLTLVESINIAHSLNAAWAEGRPMSTQPDPNQLQTEVSMPLLSPLSFRKRRWAYLL